MEDVRKILAAAQRVARDPTIVSPLVSSTGLSRQGVELALARHVETSASDEEIASLVTYAGRTERVHVVLSANVFVAAVRAVAIAIAAGERVTVRPSRREPVFAKALVDALADPRVTIGEGEGASEIHVYGRDETIADVRRAAGPRVRVRGHGAGMGIAIVTRNFADAARALAEDVIPFDQRGCSSPRVAYVRGDAEAFGRLLFEALESRGREIPRGALDEAEEAARWCSTIAYAGTLHRGDTCAVGVADVRAIPPTGRHVLVRPFPVALGDDARFVVAVGSDMSPDGSHTIAPPHARLSALGSM
ncbi:MAG TPA: acyl-CoA reductase, partial [Polyangiaceae bacterium]|nr:acyl-CoA reductase [Polyangiaceae bacterium]